MPDQYSTTMDLTQPQTAESGADGDDAAANATLSDAYSATGDFAATKRLFDLDAIRRDTHWNPPIPTLLESPPSAPRSLRNTRGWMAPDPMQLTGYTALPDVKKDERDANRDLFEFAKRTYGVRFHFNPPTFAESFANTQGSDPINTVRAFHSVANPPLGKQSGSSFNLSLLFTRELDLRILRRPYWMRYYDPNINAYEPSLTNAQMRDQILSRGTMVDVEYIFRLINGKPWDVWWSDSPDGSSDWGAFFPRPVVMSLGDGPHARRLRGFMTSLSFTHQQFAPGMVPVYTQVDIAFERILDFQSKPVDWDNPEQVPEDVSPPTASEPTDELIPSPAPTPAPTPSAPNLPLPAPSPTTPGNLFPTPNPGQLLPNPPPGRLWPPPEVVQ